MEPNWQAQFIAPSFALEPAGPAPYFRREFTVDERPERATLHVTALGVVEPHLNGARVGDEVLAPGWTSYHHRLPVSVHDVTEQILTGANAVGAVVGEGWAVGEVGYSRQREYWADRPALFLRLSLEYPDRTEVIGTGTDFTCATGAVLAHSLFHGETHDARREPGGWDLPGFDDGSWTAAEPVDWDLDTLFVRTAEPIRRTAELAPAAITTSPSGRTIVDFGQNLSGRVRLRVDGSPGETVTVRHAEILTGGELDTRSLRSVAATDRYRMRGDGPEEWEPRFTVHGFRYAEIEGPFETATAVAVHSDMPRTGWFEASNELLNRLHANTVWSMRGNFVGLPTDCPQRDERLGWTGDINAFGPTAVFLYDTRGVLGSWLADVAAEQREQGFVPKFVPYLESYPSPSTALWSDVVVSLPWAMYREYGDSAILRDAYPSMTAFIRDTAETLNADGLRDSGFQYGDWLDPDAPGDDPAGGKADRYLVANAYLARTAREAAQIAAILGEQADADEFGALADRVRTAFRRAYLTEDGALSEESAAAYALALSFGLFEPDERQRAGERLASLVADAGYTISTGFAGTPWVLPALSDTGQLEAAYRLLLQTECPSFLYPIAQGATTIWERWDAIRPDGTMHPAAMTSFNHYALGAAVDWLHRTVGGLSPIEPGYRRMRIAPKPGGDLTSADLRLCTVHGDVRVSWRLDGGQVSIEATVPEGTEAVVELPLNGGTEEVAAGRHSWSYAAAQPA
ncbi:alpha-L-rhamnosidase [Glycomyces arizonensis]|uniref:alpha-L-rhamnosidase n=1 Tax=Glycomyces arizonensis TaxID=256035 RepID=UPI0004197C74|nr:alpha-L-rhamnosidase [Glycomyces arizonensis]